MKAKLKSIIAQAANVSEDQIKLEHPNLEEHGDYSTNIALILKGGRKLAEEIAQKIAKTDLIEKVEVAGPGFINIWLQKDRLISQLDGVTRILSDKDTKKKTVIVEYSSPNIAKPFGIGHLSSTIIGQSLYNIYKYLGYKVIGDNHLGDWGTQFGKLIFMIINGNITDFSIENLEKLYVEFHQHPEWEDEGQKWFKKLEEGDVQAKHIWQKCVDVSLTEFKRIYSLLGVEIDNAYGESSYEALMPEVIIEAKSKGIALESQGALIIETGHNTPLMLLKSDGGTTYATRDLATLKFRQQKWKPDIVIYEVGMEQTLHFAQLFVAAKYLGYTDSQTELVHTKHGLYLDTDGKKFSTRKGKTVKLEEILQEAIDRAKALGNKEEATAKVVGIGAIKYFNLSHNIQSDVVFDWGKIMALEGNSGPYLQYTYARTQSILNKSQITNDKSQINFKFQNSNFKLNEEELSVLRHIYKFPEVIEEAAMRYAPNLVCEFLYDLAQRFNTFYAKHSILGPQDNGDKEFRVYLTSKVGEVLKLGLNLLGIEALERM